MVGILKNALLCGIASIIIATPSFSSEQKEEAVGGSNLEGIVEIFKDGKYDNTPFLFDESKNSLMDLIKDSVYEINISGEYEFFGKTDKEGNEIIETVKKQGGSAACTVIKVTDEEAYILSVSHVSMPDKYTEYYDFDFGGYGSMIVESSRKVKEEYTIMKDGKKIILDKIMYTSLSNWDKDPDKTLDVALFKTKEIEGLKEIPIGFGDSNKLEGGDFLYSIGYPLGKGISIQQGIVSYINEDFVTFTISNALNPGDSGGLVIAFLDGKPEIVGINESITFGAVGINHATKISNILNVIGPFLP